MLDNAVSARRPLIDRGGGATVLTVVDEVDMATAGELRRTLHDLLDERPDTLVLDLGRVAFFGSSGISALVGAVHRSDRLGVRLVVAAARRGVRHVLEVTRTTDLVTVYDCPSEALASTIPKPREGADVPAARGVR